MTFHPFFTFLKPEKKWILASIFMKRQDFSYKFKYIWALKIWLLASISIIWYYLPSFFKIAFSRKEMTFGFNIHEKIWLFIIFLNFWSLHRNDFWLQYSWKDMTFQPFFTFLKPEKKWLLDLIFMKRYDFSSFF